MPDEIPRTEDGRHVCGRCGNRNIIGGEYWYGSPARYDGVSEWWCSPAAKGCGLRIGRWTGKVLKDEELEPRLGEGEPFVPVPCPKCDMQRNPKYPTCFGCYSSTYDR